jgi:hypothetical protein
MHTDGRTLLIGTRQPARKDATAAGGARSTRGPLAAGPAVPFRVQGRPGAGDRYGAVAQQPVHPAGTCAMIHGGRSPRCCSVRPCPSTRARNRSLQRSTSPRAHNGMNPCATYAASHNLDPGPATSRSMNTHRSPSTTRFHGEVDPGRRELLVGHRRMLPTPLPTRHLLFLDPEVVSGGSPPGEVGRRTPLAPTFTARRASRSSSVSSRSGVVAAVKSVVVVSGSRRWGVAPTTTVRQDAQFNGSCEATSIGTNGWSCCRQELNG